MDSHAHLSALTDGADAAMSAARAQRVRAVVCVGTDAASSHAAQQLATRHPDVVATAGLHPHDASRLDEEWDSIVGLVTADRVVAVGETGLDYHYLLSPAAAQLQAFHRQVELAERYDRALVVHSRDAWADTFAVLGEHGPPARTVFHCFTGGPDEARRALDLGAWLSFSGIVSFRNADEVRAAAALTPADRLLVETDAPYLAPVPHRGRQNEPALVPVVGAALAAARHESEATVAAATGAAADVVFGPLPTL